MKIAAFAFCHVVDLVEVRLGVCLEHPFVNPTTAPAIEHTDVAAASMEKLTGSPDVAVAVTVCFGPPTTAPAGALDVNVIV